VKSGEGIVRTGSPARGEGGGFPQKMDALCGTKSNRKSSEREARRRKKGISSVFETRFLHFGNTTEESGSKKLEKKSAVLDVTKGLLTEKGPDLKAIERKMQERRGLFLEKSAEKQAQKKAVPKIISAGRRPD